jgi:hypothetical protein
MKKFLLTICLITVTLVTLPEIGAAAVQIVDDLKPGYAAEIPLAVGNRAAPINVILQLIAGSLIYAAGPAAVLMIAIGGFRYVVSHGDTTQMEGAKKTIMWAIIGLLVIIVSYAIVTNIINIASTTTV